MRRPNPELLAMLATTAALTVVSCLLRQGVGNQEGLWASDVRVMWFERGLDVGRFPLAAPVAGAPSPEYPVLTALLMWLVALPVHSISGFLWLSAAVLGACAMGITALLYPLLGRMTWLWAAAPPLAWYLLANYDAFASLFAVAALALLAGRDAATISSGRLYAAAALLGLGGAAKLYPLLLLLPVVLWLLTPRPRDGRRRALVVLAVAAGAFIVVNLPFAITSPDGWLAPYRYQAARPISIDTFSIWAVFGAFPAIPSSAVNMASAVVTALAMALVALVSWRRGLAERAYPLLPAAAALLAAYLVANKVYSPQCALWLLPLLLLARTKPPILVVYLVLDTLLIWALTATNRGGGMVMVVGGVALVVFVVLRFGLTIRIARGALATD